jgi:hypothetical protein
MIPRAMRQVRVDMGVGRWEVTRLAWQQLREGAPAGCSVLHRPHSSPHAHKHASERNDAVHGSGRNPAPCNG